MDIQLLGIGDFVYLLILLKYMVKEHYVLDGSALFYNHIGEIVYFNGLKENNKGNFVCFDRLFTNKNQLVNWIVIY